MLSDAWEPPLQRVAAALPERANSFSAGGYALRADGSVWAWGHNYWGALGNDSVLSDYTVVPVRVNGLSGVSAVIGSSSSGYALVS